MLFWLTKLLSPGFLVVIGVAVVSTILVVRLPVEQKGGAEFWVTALRQRDSYLGKVAEWNEAHSDTPFEMKHLYGRALEQQMLSGFLSGTPVADLIETDESIFPKAFLGPLDQIGFLDITDRMHEEGIYEQFNEPSLSQQISRGRHFGLPHDVHPVLLAYRSDIVEAAGIDVSEIETWDDYFRVMWPLMQDFDGDGRADRYLLNLSEIRWDILPILLLQNDGRIFDDNDVPVFASERNAQTLAKVMTWITGPAGATIDIPWFSSSTGHRQMLDGLVVGNITPDWLIGFWKMENPQLGGKIKLMPLPAFERGGRRTSVRGGSMIGISKRSAYIEEAWEMAKALYLSPEIAEVTWRQTNILSPVKALWNEPFYHEPDPFCGGQAIGTLYIEAAPHTPRRSSSPYTNVAFHRISSAAIALRAYAEKNEVYDVESLAPEALKLLQKEELALKKLISRNMFLGGED